MFPDQLHNLYPVLSTKNFIFVLSLFTNIDGLRRAPASYADMVYYSQVAFDYKAKDGVPRYVKFRLINSEGRPETGLLTEEEQRKVW